MTSPPDPGARPAAGSPASDGPPEPVQDPKARRDRAYLRERKALRWGLGLSAVLHVVAVLLYPVVMDRTEPSGETASDRSPEEVIPGLEIIVMRDGESPADEAPPEPEEAPPELPDVELEEPEPEPATEPDPDLAATPEARIPFDLLRGLPRVADRSLLEETDEERLTAGERLRPRPGDPRLWAYLIPEVGQLSDQERAELLLEGILTTWNDSVAVAAALSDRQTDWTYVDEDGGRWGLSPGRLHLGDFSIPLPFQFEVPRFHQQAFEQRQWEIEDILRGASTAEIRQIWSNRAREIRERMDEERNRNRTGGGGG